ncbi:MAG: hypothetical protein LBQ90_02165 [Synergistaceae bacterium]|jgi:hypothetical protein|nr:hypothetical protein [Synergistaceae bacterium]
MKKSRNCSWGDTERIVEVYDAFDFAAINADAVSRARRYILMADIDVGDEWWPVGVGDEEDNRPFTGLFDGGGHTVTLGGIAGDPECAGLFGLIGEGGTVQNLAVRGRISMDSKKPLRLGGIVGALEAGGSVKSCVSSVDITAASDEFVRVGGVAGINYGGTISDCRSDGAIRAMGGNGVAGGIVGICKGCSLSPAVVENCVSQSDLKAGGVAGGIVGRHACSSVVNCVALNASVESGVTRGRVVGENFLLESIQMINNYGGVPGAWRNDAGGQDGADCGTRPPGFWWRDASTWDIARGEPWSFDAIWVWDAEEHMPRLTWETRVVA